MAWRSASATTWTITFRQLICNFSIAYYKHYVSIMPARDGWGEMTFAENLRRARVERFLSQRELARQAGLHAITLVRLEAGATAPSSRSVRALAAALGVEPRDLTAPDEVAELRRVLRSAGAVGEDGNVDARSCRAGR
jgi:DNA-binding XRE family transcriptional regulator